MSRFYALLSIILITYVLHFILVYRRFKREGSDFKLQKPHSWKRLEDYLPWLVMGLSLNAIDDTPIETYLIEFGLSDLSITLIEIFFSVALTLIALLGFKIYLKAIGWEKRSLKDR